MSANIFWTPTGKGRSVDTGTPSRFISSLKSVFGELPVELGTNEVAQLRAMAAVSDDTGYQNLIDAIEIHGPIRVWAEY